VCVCVGGGGPGGGSPHMPVGIQPHLLVVVDGKPIVVQGMTWLGARRGELVEPCKHD
jgi:hypothetical protein